MVFIKMVVKFRLIDYNKFIKKYLYVDNCSWTACLHSAGYTSAAKGNDPYEYEMDEKEFIMFALKWS